MFQKLLSIIAFIFVLAIVTQSAFSQTNQPVYANPNPCDTGSTIFFSLSANDTVSLVVFNQLGQTATTFYIQNILIAASYQVYFNTKNLASGVYLVALTINSKHYTAKIIVSHLVTSVGQIINQSPLVYIYPNPVIDNLFINCSAPLDILIYNELGQLVIKANNINQFLSLKNLNTGIYECLLYSETNCLLKKITLVKNYE